MNYTQNPELDAARHDDELDALDEFNEKAQAEAPRLVLKDLQAIKTPGEWFRSTFHAGNSAEDILRDGMSVDDGIADRYTEFVIDATPEAKQKMLRAMADWFGKIYALEIYSDYMTALCDD